MEYSEKELIDFANYCINRRNDKFITQRLYDSIAEGVNDAELQNWKENLKQKRREEKINNILNG